jgi:hypothetical protein
MVIEAIFRGDLKMFAGSETAKSRATESSASGTGEEGMELSPDGQARSMIVRGRIIVQVASRRTPRPCSTPRTQAGKND